MDGRLETPEEGTPDCMIGDLNWAAALSVLVPVPFFEWTSCLCDGGLERSCLEVELIVADIGPPADSDLAEEHSILREGSTVVVKMGDRNGVINFLYCRCCDASVDRLGVGGTSSTPTFMRFGWGDICSVLISDNDVRSLDSAGLFLTLETTGGSTGSGADTYTTSLPDQYPKLRDVVLLRTNEWNPCLGEDIERDIPLGFPDLGEGCSSLVKSLELSYRCDFIAGHER